MQSKVIKQSHLGTGVIIVLLMLLTLQWHIGTRNRKATEAIIAEVYGGCSGRWMWITERMNGYKMTVNGEMILPLRIITEQDASDCALSTSKYADGYVVSLFECPQLSIKVSLSCQQNDATTNSRRVRLDWSHNRKNSSVVIENAIAYTILADDSSYFHSIAELLSAARSSMLSLGQRPFLETSLGK